MDLCMMKYFFVLLSVLRVECSSVRDVQLENPGTSKQDRGEVVDQLYMNFKLDNILDRLKKMEDILMGYDGTHSSGETKESLAMIGEELKDNSMKYLELKSMFEQDKKRVSASVYTRWGRISCPGNGSMTLYSGFAGGSHYTHTGGASSMLCLPQDPEWPTDFKYSDRVDTYTGLIYGTEYQDGQERGDNLFGRTHYQEDVPCAVCHVNRQLVLMIPGKTTCHPGWTLEYNGYLMAGHYKHAGATDYYCIDKQPQATHGGANRNDNGYLLYFVEGQCGSLKCPPYYHGREILCVVCTK